MKEIECEACKGRGDVKSADSVIHCDRCGGTGRLLEVCQHDMAPNADGSMFTCVLCGLEKERAAMPNRHLGTMNDWPKRGNPPAYDRCVALKHDVECKSTRSCFHTYSCPICKITFCADSSG